MRYTTKAPSAKSRLGTHVVPRKNIDVGDGIKDLRQALNIVRGTQFDARAKLSRGAAPKRLSAGGGGFDARAKLSRPSARGRAMGGGLMSKHRREMHNFTVSTGNTMMAYDPDDSIELVREANFYGRAMEPAAMRSARVSHASNYVPTPRANAAAALGAINMLNNAFTGVGRQQHTATALRPVSPSVTVVRTVPKIVRTVPSLDQLKARRTKAAVEYDDVDMLEDAGPVSSRELPRPKLLSSALQSRMAPCVVLITNLAGSVTEDDVKELCSTVNGFKSARLLEKGVAQATFSGATGAQKMIDEYDRREFDGVEMHMHIISGGAPPPDDAVTTTTTLAQRRAHAAAK